MPEPGANDMSAIENGQTPPTADVVSTQATSTDSPVSPALNLNVHQEPGRIRKWARNLMLASALTAPGGAIMATTANADNPAPSPSPTAGLPPTDTDGVRSGGGSAASAHFETAQFNDRTFTAGSWWTSKINAGGPVNPEPTPTPVESPTPTTGPEPIKSKDFLKIVEHFAEFDTGGELADDSGDFQINYSRDLLNEAGIEGVTAPSDAIQNAHDIIVNTTYEAVHKKVGSTLGYGERPNLNVTTPLDNIVTFAVSEDEYLGIMNSLSKNHIQFSLGGVSGILYSNQRGLMYEVSRQNASSGLGTIPENWDRKDVGSRLAHDGFGCTFADITAAAQFAQIGGGFDTPDNLPLYASVGITLENMADTSGVFNIEWSNPT